MDGEESLSSPHIDGYFLRECGSFGFPLELYASMCWIEEGLYGLYIYGYFLSRKGSFFIVKYGRSMLPCEWREENLSCPHINGCICKGEFLFRIRVLRFHVTGESQVSLALTKMVIFSWSRSFSVAH